MSQSTPPASASNTKDAVSQKIVVLSRKRRLKKIGVRRMDGEQTAEDFLEDLKVAMSAQQMSWGENFITYYLEGAAREEVRLFPKQDSENLDRILDILLEADLDLTLRDQFANNVWDPVLQKELRKFIREHPSITLLDIREKVLRWSEEEEKPWRLTHESTSHEVWCQWAKRMQLLYCLNTFPASPRCTIETATVQKDLTKTIQAMRSVEPHPMNRHATTSQQVFKLWERR